MLRDPKINKHRLIAEVLSSFSFDELQIFKRRMPKMFHGLLKVPKLKRKCFDEVFVKGQVLSKESVDIYGSMTFIVLNNVTEINKYIEIKNQLIQATAISSYNEAYSLLDNIEKYVSASMFGTYFGLRLKRLEKGITEATNLYNEIYKRNSTLRYFTTICLKTSHIDLPIEQDVDRLYQSFLGDDETRDFITAIAFPFKKTNGDNWLRLLLATSLIDLYEGFIFQLCCLSKEKLNNVHIRELVTKLSESIDDIRLQRLYAFINNGKTLGSFKDTSEARNLIENYYSGEYNYVIQKGREYLKINPLCATILNLYHKSCVKIGQMPEDLFPEDSLAGRLHSLHYESITNSPISETCRVLLRSLSIAWHQIPQVKQLYHNFKDLDREGSIYENYWRYSFVPEIKDALFFNSVENAVDYLDASGYSKEFSTLAKILIGARKDYYNQTRRLLYGFSDSDINAYRLEIETDEPTPLVMNYAVSQLFKRLMELGSIADAVSLYVRYSIENPHAKIEIDKKKITSLMTDPKDAKIADQLTLSIFYTMIGAETYKRYLAYKRFLKSQKLRRASEIDGLDTPKLKYFVGKVVDRTVLNLHILEFETEDDVVNERIELCKKIYTITNDKAYSDEITTLIKEQEITTLAQQVNDSKIHVDVQSLISGELSEVKILFESYLQIDDNLEIYEQESVEGLLDFLQKNNGRKSVIESDELPSVRYKKEIFNLMFLNIRDKFLLDPIYGLDKYLSARIRHGTLLTQLRNHFLAYSLVTNKKVGGDYERTSPWTQHKSATLSDDAKNIINERLLHFTMWLDDQLKVIKDEIIQIKTERIDGASNGLFDYSFEKMANLINELGTHNYDSFEAFFYPAVDLLWKWTGLVLERVRSYFRQYEEMVLEMLTELQKDVIMAMRDAPLLITSFKDAITDCRRDFQADIAVVTDWFKLEQSKVRTFNVRQAVDTSLSVINKMNQNTLAFSKISITDTSIYNGKRFNAIHDIFHDMMNNILEYEAKRPNCKGKSKINIARDGNILRIIVSNPIDEADIQDLKKIVEAQKNIPELIASGKTRREKNSGCVKIYSTVMYTLGSGNWYENFIENNHFLAHIEIDTKNLLYNEDTDS